MQSEHYRKIELQSPADLTYLYTNAVAESRQKLDLHFPPSAFQNGDQPDPMKERVKELVDDVRQYLLPKSKKNIRDANFKGDIVVHQTNIYLRLRLADHKRPRIRFRLHLCVRFYHQNFGKRHPIPLPISILSTKRNNRIRALRRQACLARKLSIRATGVVDYDGRAVETRCAGKGGEDVCGEFEGGVGGGG